MIIVVTRLHEMIIADIRCLGRGESIIIFDIIRDYKGLSNKISDKTKW